MEKPNLKLSKKLCPRCRKKFLYEEQALNSLSREDLFGERYICNSCGEEEAIEDLKKRGDS